MAKRELAVHTEMLGGGGLWGPRVYRTCRGLLLSLASVELLGLQDKANNAQTVHRKYRGSLGFGESTCIQAVTKRFAAGLHGFWAFCFHEIVSNGGNRLLLISF